MVSLSLTAILLLSVPVMHEMQPAVRPPEEAAVSFLPEHPLGTQNLYVR